MQRIFIFVTSIVTPWVMLFPRAELNRQTHPASISARANAAYSFRQRPFRRRRYRAPNVRIPSLLLASVGRSSAPRWLSQYDLAIERVALSVFEGAWNQLPRKCDGKEAQPGIDVLDASHVGCESLRLNVYRFDRLMRHGIPDGVRRAMPANAQEGADNWGRGPNGASKLTSVTRLRTSEPGHDPELCRSRRRDSSPSTSHCNVPSLPISCTESVVSMNLAQVTIT